MQGLKCFCFYLIFLGPLILINKCFEKLYKHFIKVLIQMKWLHRAIPNTGRKICISLLQRLTVCSVKRKTECLCLPPQIHIYPQVNLHRNAQCLSLKEYIILPYCPFSLKTMTLSTTYHHI